MPDVVQALQNNPAVQRRRILGLVTIAGLLSTGLVFALSSQTEDKRCQGANAELTGVWDDEVKRAVKATFLATGMPHAGQTYELVERVLDTYKKDWLAMLMSTCKRTQIDGSQSEQLLDLRMACLTRRRSGLMGLTGFLSKDFDPELLSKSITASQELAPIAACADATALSARQSAS